MHRQVLRTLFLLLLLANVAFLSYTRLDAPGEKRVEIRPETIRLLTPQQVAGMQLNATPGTELCVEWGPFRGTERVRALSDLHLLGGEAAVTERYLEAPASYWVFLGSFAGRAAAQQRIAELPTSRKSDQPWLVENAPGEFAVSLGVFNNEEGATRYAAELGRLGVTDTHIGPRYRKDALVKFLVRDVPEDVLAGLRHLQAEYPGAELRPTKCAEASSSRAAHHMLA